MRMVPKGEQPPAVIRLGLARRIAGWDLKVVNQSGTSHQLDQRGATSDY